MRMSTLTESQSSPRCGKRKPGCPVAEVLRKSGSAGRCFLLKAKQGGAGRLKALEVSLPRLGGAGGVDGALDRW